MDNQSQNGVNGQNMGCNMNGYSPLPSWFVPPNYIYQQPMQGNNPDQPIPFPSISAPPPYSFQSSVVTPMQQASNDEVIDLANSASDDDSSDEPISENDSETHSSSAPDFCITVYSLLPRHPCFSGVLAANLRKRIVCEMGSLLM